MAWLAQCTDGASKVAAVNSALSHAMGSKLSLFLPATCFLSSAHLQLLYAVATIADRPTRQEAAMPIMTPVLGLEGGAPGVAAVAAVPAVSGEGDGTAAELPGAAVVLQWWHW